MNEVESLDYKLFKLPLSIMTKMDVSRLVNEMEGVDNAMIERGARAESDIHQAEPRLSERLRLFIDINKLSLEDSNFRSQLIVQLRKMKETLVVIHITFASEVDPESLQDVVSWLRKEVHSQTVVSTGVQPGLVAGVSLRSSNRVFDMSLQSVFAGKRNLLLERLEANNG